MIRQQKTLDNVRRDIFEEVVPEIERLIPEYRSGRIDFQELFDLADVYRRGVTNRESSKNVDLRKEEDISPAVDMAFYKAVSDFDFSGWIGFSTWFREKVRGEISHIRAVRDGNTKKYRDTISLDAMNEEEKTRLEGLFVKEDFVEDFLDSEDIEHYMPFIFEDLSKKDKLIVYLRYGCGFSLSQIGERIGKHKTNMGKRLTSFINPVLSERIERFEIPYNLRVFMRVVRDYYQDREF